MGHLHKTDDSALAVKFNTEGREALQFPRSQHAKFGIDSDRYQVVEGNSPSLIFDQIEYKIPALIQEGAPIKLIIIDSLSGIMGRRSENAESVDVSQIGDEALTLKTGLKRILHVLRENHIALIVTNQANAEMDALEIKRGHKIKMNAAFAAKHFLEYFIYVEKDRTVDGRKDALGNEFLNSEKKAGMDDKKKEKSGFKIYFEMTKSSASIDGRSGQITWDYLNGLINTHEEVFTLGINLGIIQRPTPRTYTYRDQKWGSFEDTLNAIRDDKKLYDAILTDIKLLDKDR